VLAISLVDAFNAVYADQLLAYKPSMKEIRNQGTGLQGNGKGKKVQVVDR
jgi:hypothetical protein